MDTEKEVLDVDHDAQHPINLLLGDVFKVRDMRCYKTRKRNINILHYIINLKRLFFGSVLPMETFYLTVDEKMKDNRVQYIIIGEQLER